MNARTRTDKSADFDLDISRKFTLGEHLTDEQLAFFDTHGFIHFEGFASMDEVDRLRGDMQAIEDRWMSEGRTKVNGTPIKFGRDMDGDPMVQRFCFTSQFSDAFHDFVTDERFEPVKALIGEGCRVAEREKDGVVVNHWINVEGSAYKQLGWHTDGLRDIFLHRRKPGPMLNVGVYLDDSPRSKGGLRLIPGSHKQNLFNMMFHKLYFLDNREDPREISVEAKAGDLTVHDGRLWHRVARASATGEASRRRIMYIPFIDGPYEPKHPGSPTPIYHHFQRLVG